MMDKWQIERRDDAGKLWFCFTYAGDDDEFRLVEKVIVEKMGGKVTDRLFGPADEVLVTLDVGGHAIVLRAGDWDFFYFYPTDARDNEFAENFAVKLHEFLRATEARALT